MDKQIFTVTADKVDRYRQRVTIVAKSMHEAEAIASKGGRKVKQKENRHGVKIILDTVAHLAYYPLNCYVLCRV